MQEVQRENDLRANLDRMDRIAEDLRNRLDEARHNVRAGIQPKRRPEPKPEAKAKACHFFRSRTGGKMSRDIEADAGRVERAYQRERKRQRAAMLMVLASSESARLRRRPTATSVCKLRVVAVRMWRRAMSKSRPLPSRGANLLMRIVC